MRLDLTSIELLTLALVIVTGYYAWLTRRILKTQERTVEVMKDQFEAAYRPYVVIAHHLGSDGRIYLRVTNSGQSSAQNLKLSVDSELYQLGVKHERYNLSNHNAFAAPIPHFPSGAELTLALREVDYVIMTGQVKLGEEALDAPSPLKFGIRAQYAFGEEKFDESTEIDLTVYDKSFQPSDSVDRLLARIVHELHEISGQLSSKSTDAA